jgi:CRP-like cAMP-binding protein
MMVELAVYLMVSRASAIFERSYGFRDGVSGPVKNYRRGDYFGELALLDDKPRQASITTKTGPETPFLVASASPDSKR